MFFLLFSYVHRGRVSANRWEIYTGRNLLKTNIIMYIVEENKYKPFTRYKSLQKNKKKIMLQKHG